MEKSRLVELFLSLEKMEVKKLRKWVRSPFFNQREDVILLYDYLDKYRPFEKKNRLDRRYIFSKIFPNEEYNEKKIGYAQSFLLAEIKKFIAYQSFSENEVEAQIHLTRNLRKRGLNRHFESEWKITNELLQKQPHRNSEYHFHHFNLQNELYEYTNSLSRKQPKGLQEASNELTNYFIAQKLKLGCDQLSHQTLISADYQQDFLNKVLEFIHEKGTPNSLAIQIYFQSFQSLSETATLEHYQKLRELLKNHNKSFPKSELKYLFLVAINFCIQQHNAGNPEFKRELLNLYQEGLDLEVFITHGFLSRFTYKNIVSIGINLKEFEWVEAFIYNYKNYIEEPWRESTFTFNLATLYHRKPDYKKAMELLQQAEFKDVFLHLDARKMLLKMYYELEEINALESLLDSFSRYLTRHKDLGYHKNLHLDLIRVVRKLLQTPRFDKTAKAALREEIESMEGLIEKKWVLEQL